MNNNESRTVTWLLTLIDDPVVQVECTVDYPKVISILTGMGVDVDSLEVDPVDYFVLNYLADEEGVVVLSEEQVALRLVDKLYARAEQAYDNLYYRDDKTEDNNSELACLDLIKLATTAIINNDHDVQRLMFSNYDELI